MSLELESLGDVRVAVTVVVGRATASIAEVLGYAPGTVVSLDARPDAPVMLFVNGIAIATGELVTMEDGGLAVQIIELVHSADAGSPG